MNECKGPTNELQKKNKVHRNSKSASTTHFVQNVVTGISGSSPDMDRRFRFNSRTGSWRQIPLAVNDLTRENSRGCDGR